MKLAVIGAGSFRTPAIYRALADGRNDTRFDEIVFHDVDEVRLERIRTVFDGIDAETQAVVPYRTATEQGATHILVLRSRRDGEQESSNSGRSGRAIARYLSRYSRGLAAAFLDRPNRLSRDDLHLEEAEADPDAMPAVLSLRPPVGTPAIGRLERDQGRVIVGLQAGERVATAALGG